MVGSSGPDEDKDVVSCDEQPPVWCGYVVYDLCSISVVLFQIHPLLLFCCSDILWLSEPRPHCLCSKRVRVYVCLRSTFDGVRMSEVFAFVVFHFQREKDVSETSRSTLRDVETTRLVAVIVELS